MWLDEHKKILYENNHETFDDVNPGDLTKAKELRKRLNCRPFEYFLEKVMPDLEERYPWYDRPTFGSGAVQNIAARSMCLESEGGLRITRCDKNLTEPKLSQDFVLTYHRQLKLHNDNHICVDGHALTLEPCHFAFGFQLWYYDIVSCSDSR